MFSPEYVDVAIKLVPARKAARRALCLALLVTRGEIEMSFQNDPDALRQMGGAGVQDLGRKMRQWLDAEGLDFELSLAERALMAKPVGAWQPGEALSAVWRQESLAVILWSLGLLDALPGYESMADQEALLALLPVRRPTAEFIARARYRPEAEISQARKAAEIWHWRARIFEMELDPQNYPPPPGGSYDTVIAIAAEMGELSGHFTRRGGDFPALGKPYRDLDEESWAMLRGIALERHYGLNWLCGWADDWDHVPTDV